MKYHLWLKSYSELRRMRTTYKTIHEITSALDKAKIDGWGHWKLYRDNEYLGKGEF